MLDTSSGYRDRILADDRQFRLKAKIGLRELTGDDCIVSMEIEEVVNAEDVITMGSVCSSELTLNLINPPKDIDYDREKIYAYSGLVMEDGSTEYVPMGVFYPYEVDMDSGCKSVAIKAYDGMCLLEKEFLSSVPEAGRSAAEVMEEIASLTGIDIADGVRQLTELNIPFVPEEVTYRQMTGYVAGKLGAFARFNREGVLEFSWYEDHGYEISLEHQYMDGFIKTLASPITVTGIVSGTEENSYSRGIGANGTVISFENPFMDKNDMRDIWENKIAYVNDAELALIYSGQAGEQSYTLVYDIDGIWNKDEECDLIKGDILKITESETWINEHELVRVVRVREDEVEIEYLDGSEISDVPEDSSFTFSKVLQWAYDEDEEPDISEKEELPVVSISAEGEIPAKVTVLYHEPEERVLILEASDNQFFSQPEPGAECVVIYRRVTDYRIKYQPSELTWRGDPNVQAGDIVQVEEKDGGYSRVLVMSQNVELGGGLKSRIICEGNVESDAGFSSAPSPTAQKITKVYSDFQEAVREVTNKLTGKTGGIISFQYNDADLPVAMYIMEKEDPQEDQNVWCWNSNGLGFSSHGIRGPYDKVAMTSDGMIMGDRIFARSIGGESININSLISMYNEGSDENGEPYEHISDKNIILQGGAVYDGILAAVRTTGGSNLIYNSAGGGGIDEGWSVGEDTVVKIDDTGAYYNDLISQRAFELGEGTTAGLLETDVNVAVGQEHTFSFKYRKDSGIFKVTCGDEEVVNDTDSKDEWQKVVHTFKPAKSPVHISFSSSDGGAFIGDIMLCPGSSSTWTQGPNEIFGTNLSVTNDKVEISAASSAGKGLKTNLTASGLEIVYCDGTAADGASNEVTLAQYDSKTVKSGEGEFSNQVSVGKARFIPIDDNMSCMWVINKERKE